jgi:hypothetical protein
LFFVVLVAYVIGSALLLWVRLIQIVLFGIHKRVRKRWFVYLRKKSSSWNPAMPQEADSWRIRYLKRSWKRAQETIKRQFFAREAWEQVARKLLQRYEIDPPHIPPFSPDEQQKEWQRQWRPWESVLGIPRTENIRGYLLVLMLHATAWGGIAAERLSPPLRWPPFSFLCSFLVAYGLLHDNELARKPLVQFRNGILLYRVSWMSSKQGAPI